MPAVAQRYLPPAPMPKLVCADPPITVDVSDYLYLAEIVARKYYCGKDEEQAQIRDTELFSVACQELVKCVQQYDPAIGPFDRFAMRAIRNGIIQNLRLQKRKKRVAEFDPLTDADWSEVPERETDPILFRVEHLSQLLNILSSDDRKLIEDIYFANKSVAELAEKAGVSRVTIYNRRDAILRKLREGLHDIDNEG